MQGSPEGELKASWDPSQHLGLMWMGTGKYREAGSPYVDVELHAKRGVLDALTQLIGHFGNTPHCRLSIISSCDLRAAWELQLHLISTTKRGWYHILQEKHLDSKCGFY